MRIHHLLPARLGVLSLGLVITGGLHPLVAQQPTDPSPFQGQLEELTALVDRIQIVDARFSRADSSDRALYREQLVRRWREHHALLDDLVTDIVDAQDSGEPSTPAVLSRARDALSAEIEILNTWARAAGESIAAGRQRSLVVPLSEALEFEMELSELYESEMRLLEMLVADFEHAVTLGVPLPISAPEMDSSLVDQAGLVAAELEFSNDRKAILEDRLGRPGIDSATLETRLAVVEQRISTGVANLETYVSLMGRRELGTSEYEQLLLTTTGDLGTEVLDPEVVGGLLSDWGAAIMDWFGARGPNLLVQLLIVIGILFGTRVVAGLSRRIVGRVLGSDRIKVSGLLERLTKGMISKIVWVIGFLVILSIFGIDLGPALAGLGIAGFVLGFALQDTLSNFAAGLMIMVYRPFDVGDLVETGGVFGSVREVTLVSTVITTLDNQRIVVPNGMVWGAVIHNATAERTRRVDLVFGIGYADDIPKAKRLLEEVVAAEDLVLESPAPMVKVHNLGDSSVDLVCRPWCNTDDYWDVHWNVTEAVKRRFDEEGVSIPFPQRDIHVYPTEPAAPEPHPAGPTATD